MLTQSFSTPSVQTDANRRFTLSPVYPGRDNAPLGVTIRASKTGFVAQDRAVTITCGAVINVSFGANTILGVKFNDLIGSTSRGNTR